MSTSIEQQVVSDFADQASYVQTFCEKNMRCPNVSSSTKAWSENTYKHVVRLCVRDAEDYPLAECPVLESLNKSNGEISVEVGGASPIYDQLVAELGVKSDAA